MHVVVPLGTQLSRGRDVMVLNQRSFYKENKHRLSTRRTSSSRRGFE